MGKNRGKQKTKKDYLREILERDDYKCGIHVYGCKKSLSLEEATIDHIFPKQLFERNIEKKYQNYYHSPINLQPMCKSCNNKKSGEFSGLFKCDCHEVSFEELPSKDENSFTNHVAVVYKIFMNKDTYKLKIKLFSFGINNKNGWISSYSLWGSSKRHSYIVGVNHGAMYSKSEVWRIISSNYYGIGDIKNGRRCQNWSYNFSANPVWDMINLSETEKETDERNKNSTQQDKNN